MYGGAKAFFYALSRSTILKRFASRYGLATSDGFVSRFIAGETIETAIEVSRRLQSQGLLVTLDHLGEHVRTTEESTAATRNYVQLIDTVADAGIERNISLKLTQLGIDVDRATCVDNLRRILESAARREFFVRIDMENSPYTERTIEIFETLWEQQYRNLGVALQSYLYRSEADVRRMNELGARVRLIKGAYKEPPSLACQQKTDVDAAFMRLARMLIEQGTYPAIATPRRRDHPGDSRVRGRARPREGSIRIPDDLRHQARPPGFARGRGTSRAHVRAFRPRVVPLLHAAAW